MNNYKTDWESQAKDWEKGLFYGKDNPFLNWMKKIKLKNKIPKMKKVISTKSLGKKIKGMLDQE